MSEPPKSIENISHGRGGVGNIRGDDTTYFDGGIVREGPVGDHGDGAFSTGRGGSGNIGSPLVKPTKRKDNIEIPVTAMRNDDEHDRFHVGRGGLGNEVHKVDGMSGSTLAHGTGGPEVPGGRSLADKLKNELKNKLFKKKAEEKSEERV